MAAGIIRPDWSAAPTVAAAFTLRSGGVSVAPFDSLNLGAHVGDALEAVAENRRRVRGDLELPAEPSWLQQVHGKEVLDLDRESAALPADAAITRAVGRVLAIQVADCLPVLLAARSGLAVGCAHGGWRGLAAGVLEATVRAFGADAGEIDAWLGPAIGAQAFEVGEEVRAAFLGHDERAVSAFRKNSRGRWHCDLVAIARQRLAALGVRSVSGGELCTYRDAERFYSFRRDGRCGRMAALIWLTGPPMAA